MGIASLNSALSGLRVSQQQISVISNNVANVSTPGYTRKILPQSAVSLQGETIGVRAENIIRNVDLNLERDLWTQVSAVGSLNVQQTYLQRVIDFHGPPDRELSVAAEISRLIDSFSQLSDSADDPLRQAQTLNQAIDTADKINDLGDLLLDLRNDAQNDIEEAVNKINDLLMIIAEVNDQIQDNQNLSRSTAVLEDERDKAINELSGLIEISFFIRGDGVMVVQTDEGVELASNIAQTLYFDNGPVSASSFYPDETNESIRGIFVGNPITEPGSAINITERGIGGRLGGLIEVRDEILPKQTAQLDEMAHKMALRLEAQGLRLFTDGAGAIPLDTAPDPAAGPPATAVAYVGFASRIQVNENIINDPSLLQSGTYGASIPTGSNEVVRRVLEFGFSSVNYQEAFNTNPVTQVDLLNRGGDDLQTWLGLFSSNVIEGGRDLGPAQYASVSDIVTFANGDLDDPNDQFEIIFEEARAVPPIAPISVTIDLSVADTFVGVSAADQIVQHINAEITAAGVDPRLAAVASIGNNGEIIIESRGSMTIDSTTLATGMGQTGLNFLGLSDSGGVAQAPVDPYFEVQVGNANPVRITIEPGDTDVELINKLQAVDGLAVDTANFAIDGILRLRPGNDYTNPDFGGDIKIIGGPFDVDGASYGAPPALLPRAGLDNGANIVSALFGNYTISGGSIIDESPVGNVAYGSEIDASLTPPIPALAFREDLLGPDLSISTNVIGAASILDYAQKMVNEHSQQQILTEARIEDEDTLRQTIETKFLDDSGVNLDEELANLIVVQTAYAASARVLTAVDELFQELLAAFR